MPRLDKFVGHRKRQTGGLTVFTAILVLIILTMMIFYSARIGLFEQRVSANDVRQKVAFQAAEWALEQGVQYLDANSALILSDDDTFPDGSGGVRDGWFNKWTACSADNIADMTHPCGGEIPMRTGSYFYNDATTKFAITEINPPPNISGVTSRLTANLCKINLDFPEDCLPLSTATDGGTFMLMTLMGYGYSDCTDITDTNTCLGRATVSRPVGNWKALKGAPTVPLVTRSVFPPNGTAVVVPNPNGGGVGVPISAWVNNNNGYEDYQNDKDGNPTLQDPLTCNQDADAILSSGTWNTCEMQEWYNREAIPAGVACDQPAGQCACTNEESLSYKRTGNDTVLGIDIVKDEAFPCDLFHTFFNSQDDNYETIKSTGTLLEDCTSLGEGSSGIYWISGSTCNLNNATVGSPERPVVIISAASSTSITGSATIFGVLYIFDGEDPAAELTGAGTGSIYGALIIDAAFDKFTGTVNVVYSSGILTAASDLGGFGAIVGGWRDFGLPEVAW